MRLWAFMTFPEGGVRHTEFAPSQTRICDVLAAWRAAERDLALAGDDTASRERLQVIVSELRSLHGRLFDQQAETLDHDAMTEGAADLQLGSVAWRRP
jgi:hypothetical protein